MGSIIRSINLSSTVRALEKRHGFLLLRHDVLLFFGMDFRADLIGVLELLLKID